MNCILGAYNNLFSYSVIIYLCSHMHQFTMQSISYLLNENCNDILFNAHFMDRSLWASIR